MQLRWLPAFALILAAPALAADNGSTLFGRSGFPSWDQANMLDGILPVGVPLCGKGNPPYPTAIPIKGKWLALVESSTGWSLEPTRATFRDWENTASVADARFLIRQLPELKPGPVPAALLSNTPQGDTAILGDRSWKLHAVGNRLALDSGAQRWWLTPADLLPEDKYAECLRGQRNCGASALARYYDIVWAGDLDGDREPDFIFRWSHDEVLGLTLGLSRNAAAQSKLKLVAALSDGCS
jgi:hypothetical protein